MALTALQRDVCLLLANQRRADGECYVAGGAALSVALQTQRLSRDLDLFRDTIDTVARSWERDRRLLDEAGYTVTLLRERPGYVTAFMRAVKGVSSPSGPATALFDSSRSWSIRTWA